MRSRGESPSVEKLRSFRFLTSDGECDHLNSVLRYPLVQLICPVNLIPEGALDSEPDLFSTPASPVSGRCTE